MLIVYIQTQDRIKTMLTSTVSCFSSASTVAQAIGALFDADFVVPALAVPVRFANLEKPVAGSWVSFDPHNGAQVSRWFLILSY